MACLVLFWKCTNCGYGENQPTVPLCGKCDATRPSNLTAANLAAHSNEDAVNQITASLDASSISNSPNGRAGGDSSSQHSSNGSNGSLNPRANKNSRLNNTTPPNMRPPNMHPRRLRATVGEVTAFESSLFPAESSAYIPVTYISSEMPTPSKLLNNMHGDGMVGSTGRNDDEEAEGNGMLGSASRNAQEEAEANGMVESMCSCELYCGVYVDTTDNEPYRRKNHRVRHAKDLNQFHGENFRRGNLPMEIKLANGFLCTWAKYPERKQPGHGSWNPNQSRGDAFTVFTPQRMIDAAQNNFASGTVQPSDQDILDLLFEGLGIMGRQQTVQTAAFMGLVGSYVIYSSGTSHVGRISEAANLIHYCIRDATRCKQVCSMSSSGSRLSPVIKEEYKAAVGCLFGMDTKSCDSKQPVRTWKSQRVQYTPGGSADHSSMSKPRRRRFAGVDGFRNFFYDGVFEEKPPTPLLGQALKGGILVYGGSNEPYVALFPPFNGIRMNAVDIVSFVNIRNYNIQKATDKIDYFEKLDPYEVVVCPEGHDLTPFVTDDDQNWCDGCAQQQAVETNVMQCCASIVMGGKEKCDYLLCSLCNNITGCWGTGAFDATTVPQGKDSTLARHLLVAMKGEGALAGKLPFKCLDTVRNGIHSLKTGASQLIKKPTVIVALNGFFCGNPTYIEHILGLPETMARVQALLPKGVVLQSLEEESTVVAGGSVTDFSLGYSNNGSSRYVTGTYADDPDSRGKRRDGSKVLAKNNVWWICNHESCVGYHSKVYHCLVLELLVTEGENVQIA